MALKIILYYSNLSINNIAYTGLPSMHSSLPMLRNPLPILTIYISAPGCARDLGMGKEEELKVTMVWKPYGVVV